MRQVQGQEGREEDVRSTEIEVIESDAWRKGFAAGIVSTVVVAAAFVAFVWRVIE